MSFTLLTDWLWLSDSSRLLSVDISFIFTVCRKMYTFQPLLTAINHDEGFLYLELQGLGGCRDVGTLSMLLNVIVVLTFMLLQLLICVLILVLVMIGVLIVVQVQATLLVKVFSGHELCAFTGASLGQLIHTVT